MTCDNSRMGAVKQLVSVEEYLHTSYEPDCDYVDGELVDRNVGEKKHAYTQGEIFFYFRQRRKEWNIFPIPEARIQVSATRFRVPDVAVFLRPEPDERIFTCPPFLCVEVLSPEDRMSRMQDRIDDYLNFGVRYVWVIDPSAFRAWVYAKGRIEEVKQGTLWTEDPRLEVPLTELFEGDV